jgi:mycofactocin precursor
LTAGGPPTGSSAAGGDPRTDETNVVIKATTLVSIEEIRMPKAPTGGSSAVVVAHDSAVNPAPDEHADVEATSELVESDLLVEDVSTDGM